MSGKKPHLIAYDIRCPRRLARVYRFLKSEALPVQYSVFLGCLDRRTLGWLLSELASRIDPREDDVRIYALPSDFKAEVLGEQFLPDDVYLFPDDCRALGQFSDSAANNGVNPPPARKELSDEHGDVA